MFTFRKIFPARLSLILAMLALVFSTFAWAGPRAALLMMLGLGFGLILEGLRFGFAGPWRQMLAERDSRGLVAQFMAIALFAVVAFPLLSVAADELSGAHAPIGIAMAVAAFVFGLAMQVVMGCGSGVLINAGSGNLAALLALPGFVVGSFWGSLHLGWWTDIGSLPVLSLQDLVGVETGLLITLVGLLVLVMLAVWRAAPGKRLPGSRLRWAAVLLALVAAVHLMVAGQSWGVVYGLGLWGAKVSQALGVDVAATAYWAADANAERLQQSLFTDVTSLTNIGMLAGAFAIMWWRRSGARPSADAQVKLPGYVMWLIMFAGGLVLGYSARIAFGCNVGAFFSGIATGSLHGWVWFIAAFAGAAVGIRLRQRLIAWSAERTSTAQPSPARPACAMAAMVLVATVIITDVRTAIPVNPFTVPMPSALGSGQAPEGAHCTQL